MNPEHEWKQIQKFAAACRRQWPGAKITIRPSTDTAAKGADADPIEPQHPERRPVMADEFETETGADDIEKLYSGKYLGAIDVPKPIRTKILDWDTEDLRQQDNTTKEKVVLSCANVDKKVVVNKTNYLALKQGFGKKHPRDWVGRALGIKTAMKQNGKLGLELVALSEPLKTAAAPMPTKKPAPKPAPKATVKPWPEEGGDPGFDPDLNDSPNFDEAAE
jgi:hypothetical protein